MNSVRSEEDHNELRAEEITLSIKDAAAILHAYRYRSRRSAKLAAGTLLPSSENRKHLRADDLDSVWPVLWPIRGSKRSRQSNAAAPRTRNNRSPAKAGNLTRADSCLALRRRAMTPAARPIEGTL